LIAVFLSAAKEFDFVLNTLLLKLNVFFNLVIYFFDVGLSLRNLTKMNNKKLLFLPALFAALSLTFLITSCNQRQEIQENAEQTEEVEDELNQKFFQIPAPTELFDLLRLEGIKPQKTVVLNQVSNLSKYNDSQSKSLNFGIYTTDLLYLSAFNQKAEVIKYFENLKQLAEDLGIANVITESTMSRIEKNISNADSLDAITNDVFFEASDNLERSGKQNTLILVITGSWIEGVYIATQMIEKFNPDSEIALRIAEQKYSLENLLEYFNTIPNDESLEDIKIKLNKLMNDFDAIEEVIVEAKSVSTSKKIIGSGTELKMTADQFNAISANIKELRTQIIENK
jgi:transcriptional regulator with XRE-family HTH domain